MNGSVCVLILLHVMKGCQESSLLAVPYHSFPESFLLLDAPVYRLAALWTWWYPYLKLIAMLTPGNGREHVAWQTSVKKLDPLQDIADNLCWCHLVLFDEQPTQASVEIRASTESITQGYINSSVDWVFSLPVTWLPVLIVRSERLHRALPFL